jgi:ABC-2 type transport system permease protein
MHSVLILLRKDFTYFRRDRGSVILTFLIPFALTYVFGQIFGVHRGQGGYSATQLIGGWAMQFLLFALVFSASSLFHEKDQGLFQRLLSGPVPRSTILWSKFLYGVCLGLLQLLVLFCAGSLLFGLSLAPHLPLLALVCVAAAGACSAFGMLLASVARTPEMARSLATFSILLMSAVGGAWFPTAFMPPFLQQCSRLTPVYWAVTGFGAALGNHASLAGLLPNLGILAGMTAGLLGLAWWRFQRGTIFD